MSPPVRAWDARRERIHYNASLHLMLAVLIIGSFLVGLFAFEIGRMGWGQNAWRRQWRNLGDADDN
jgi:hypothetical protein